MPEETPKDLCLTTSSPEASTLLPILKPSWALLPAVVPRSALSGSRLQLELQVQATWDQRNGLLCFVCTGDSVPSQGKPDDPFQRGLTEDTLPVC